MKRIQTRVGRDLTKYTENFFFGMSLRQTLLSAAGAAAVAAVYIFCPVPGIAAAACGLPLFALAFLKPDGLPAEKWLWNWVSANLLRPRLRVFEQRDALYELLWHGRLLGRRVFSRRQLMRMHEPYSPARSRAKETGQKGETTGKRIHRTKAENAAGAGRSSHQRRT